MSKNETHDIFKRFKSLVDCTKPEKLPDFMKGFIDMMNCMDTAQLRGQLEEQQRTIDKLTHDLNILTGAMVQVANEWQLRKRPRPVMDVDENVNEEEHSPKRRKPPTKRLKVDQADPQADQEIHPAELFDFDVEKFNELDDETLALIGI